jgi:hypothetical protein
MPNRSSSHSQFPAGFTEKYEVAVPLLDEVERAEAQTAQPHDFEQLTFNPSGKFAPRISTRTDPANQAMCRFDLEKNSNRKIVSSTIVTLYSQAFSNDRSPAPC